MSEKLEVKIGQYHPFPLAIKELESILDNIEKFQKAIDQMKEMNK